MILKILSLFYLFKVTFVAYENKKRFDMLDYFMTLQPDALPNKNPLNLKILGNISENYQLSCIFFLFFFLELQDTEFLFHC